MIKENQKYLNKVLLLLDIVSIFTAFIISWYIRFTSGIMNANEVHLPFKEYLVPIALVIPIYLVLYKLFKLYEPYRYKSIFEEVTNILKAVVLALLIFVLFLFLFKKIDYSRYLLFIFTLSVLLITTIERSSIRFILRHFRKKGYNKKHILIIGYSSLARELIKRFNDNKHWGYNVIGILDDYKTNRKIFKVSNKKYKKLVIINKYNIKVIGEISGLDKCISKFLVDEVFITLPMKEYEKLGQIIGMCEKSGVRTEIIPDYFKYIPAKPYVEEINGLPIINIRYVPLDNLFNAFIKRTFDILFSLATITVFSPIMITVAAIIKITSPGPIIFKQERIGFGNKPFMMYKFRSMHVQKEEEEKYQWTRVNDPRKTAFGSFIRKTSLDELPQLFNVLKGDMSVIGPRPERPHFVDQFKEEIPKYMIKHQVKPGITGWAQVNGWRGDTSIKKRIEFDIFYIENWNIFLDFKILWETVFKGFVNKNAY